MLTAHALDGCAVGSVSFPDDAGSRLATATENAIQIWHTSTGDKLRVLDSLSVNVLSAVFSPGGA